MIWAVFRWEMLQAGRRRRAYFLRWLYAAIVLVQVAPLLLRHQMGWDWLLSLLMVGDRRISILSAFTFFESLLTQHYLLLVLLTPALVGGAITEEKTRGTLEHLLTACFRPGEIILGKLLAHSYQLVLWSLLGLPLLCYFAGVARDMSLPAFVVATSVALTLGIAALAILMSVWCRTTRAAVFGVYLLMGIGVLLIPPLWRTPWGSGLVSLNPLHVFSLDGVIRWRPASDFVRPEGLSLPAVWHKLPRISLDDHSLRWTRLGTYLTAWLSLAVVCLVMASWQLRRAYRRQLESHVRRGLRRWLGILWRRPGNLVLWREGGVAALVKRNLRRPWLSLLSVIGASAGALAYLLMRSHPPANNYWDIWGRWAQDALYWQGLGALLLFSLMAAIRASGSITGEKEKGTWLALMVTPLTSPEVISGKMRGVFWDCVPFVAAHVLITLPVSLLLGIWPTIWTILWTSVMVLAIRWCGAVGLWCSARSASSWRSLLATLTLSYCGGILLFWRPGGLSAFAGLLPISLGGALGVGCTLWATMSWRHLVAMMTVFYFAWFVLFWPSMAAFPGAVSWTFWFWLAAAFWYSTRYLLASAVACVGRADRWEMGVERDPPA
jgi:ABC-type transport system involved in multi-copper enzyme maturation permease subunit